MERSPGIRVLPTMSRTLFAHHVGRLNRCNLPNSSSPLERTNITIGLLLRRAYDSRRYDHFKLRLVTLHDTKFTCSG